jgi:hypothetical protein
LRIGRGIESRHQKKSSGGTIEMENQTRITKIALGVTCGILLVPVVLAAGCMACVAGIGVFSVIPSPPHIKLADVSVQLLDVEITPTPDGTVITLSGSLRNVSMKVQSDVAITVEWLDQEGQVVEQTTHVLVGPGDPLLIAGARAFEITSRVNPAIRNARYDVVTEHPQAP